MAGPFGPKKWELQMDFERSLLFEKLPAWDLGRSFLHIATPLWGPSVDANSCMALLSPKPRKLATR